MILSLHDRWCKTPCASQRNDRQKLTLRHRHRDGYQYRCIIHERGISRVLGLKGQCHWHNRSQMLRFALRGEAHPTNCVN
jgi:hypothetical protein